MDINSLLSPQDPSTPNAGTSPPPSSANASPPRQILHSSVPHRTTGPRSHPESPLVKECDRSPLTPATSSYNAQSEVQHAVSSVAYQNSLRVDLQSPSSTADQRPSRISRHTSTPQMDTLAGKQLPLSKLFLMAGEKLWCRNIFCWQDAERGFSEGRLWCCRQVTA